MILMLVIGVPLIIGAPWIFLYLSPKDAEPKRLRRFNMTIMSIAALLSLGLAYTVRAAMIDSADAAWWPMVALGAGSLLFALLLLVAGLIRNFGVFH